MYCYKCGTAISDEVSFCPNCGADQKKDDDVKRIKLRCKSCDGIMEVSENQREIYCPYCGEKEIILDSDAVEIERIKSETQKEIELEKLKIEKEKKAQEEKKARQAISKTNQQKVLRNIGKILKLVLAFLCLAFARMSIFMDYSYSAAIALVQGGLFLLSWLIGMNLIKTKRRGLSTLLTVIAVLLIIPYFMATNIRTPRKIIWPDSELAEQIPALEDQYGNAYSNNSDYLSITIDKTDEATFRAYRNQCREMGFTIDSEVNTNSYSAYNEDGYKLDLYFYTSSDSFSIRLNAPLNATKYHWPTTDIAKLVPVPKSEMGKIDYESNTGFAVYVAETTRDDYHEYCDTCYNSGFSVNYSRSDDYYYAYNEDGYHISVSYEGFNTMRITVRVPN